MKVIVRKPSKLLSGLLCLMLGIRRDSRGAN